MDELDSSENEDSEKFNFGSVHNNDQFKFSYEYTHENIPQVDGLDNLDINKNIFSVNCELEELVVIMNFFRSFQFIWKLTTQHTLCTFEKKGDNCFFCLMRSSCLRLNAYRSYGPKSLKVVEIASQMHKYESFLNWDWRNEMHDLNLFIVNTLKLLIDAEESLLDSLIFQHTTKECETCNIYGELVIDLDVTTEGVLCIEDVVKNLTQNLCSSCNESFISNTKYGLVIVRFSKAASLNISRQIILENVTVSYLSHIAEEVYVGPICNFSLERDIFCQDKSGNICYEAYV